MNKKISFLNYFWKNTWVLVVFAIAISGVIYLLVRWHEMSPREARWVWAVLWSLVLIRALGLVPGYRKL